MVTWRSHTHTTHTHTLPTPTPTLPTPTLPTPTLPTPTLPTPTHFSHAHTHAQNNIERLYCTGILVIGACFYAIVVGHMSLLVNNMNPTASRHKFKKDIINNTVR